MRLDDITEVYAIELASFPSPWSEDMLRYEVGADGALTRVAVCDDRVAGYVMAMQVLDEAQLLRIAIMKSCRRRRIAKMLMDDLVSRLKQRGVAKIYLEVRVSNSAAINLYRGFGFSDDRIRKDYYSSPVEDARVMTLEI